MIHNDYEFQMAKERLAEYYMHLNDPNTHKPSAQAIIDEIESDLKAYTPVEELWDIPEGYREMTLGAEVVILNDPSQKWVVTFGPFPYMLDWYVKLEGFKSDPVPCSTLRICKA